MNSNYISVDTDRMGSGISAFGSVGGQIQRIFGALQSAAEEHYGSWGDDETGQSFAQGYLPSAEQLFTGLRTGTSAVISTGQGIAQMVSGYTDTEDQNIQATSGMLRGGQMGVPEVLRDAETDADSADTGHGSTRN